MKQLTEKPGNPKSTKPRKPGPSARGRKPSAAPRQKFPAGRGAARLRSSVNTMVGNESDDIARALVDKAKAGNMTGARLLVELSGAQKAPPEKKKKRGLIPWVKRLANEPEWDPATEKGLAGEGAITVLEDGTIKRDASKLPPSEPDWPDDDEPGEIWVNGRWERPAKPASPKA